MGSTVEVSCKWCECQFTARIADRKRGWAKCCSKACAARFREFGYSKAAYEQKNPCGKRVPNIVRYSQRLGALPSMPLINPTGKKKKKPPKWIRGVLAGAMFKENSRDQYEDDYGHWGHPMASGFEGHGQS